MKRLKFGLLLVLFTLCVIVGNTQAHPNNSIIPIETRMLNDLQSVNETLTTSEPISPQERLDTLVKAFSRLPAEELKRLGVDLSSHPVAGSEEADSLFRAWAERQAELKTAMKSVLQPAEFMSKLAATLKNTSSSREEKAQSLVDLESLLDDIDNARDFHTIGAWPDLVNALSATTAEIDNNTPPTQVPDVPLRTLAAWAVGTAVKNSYDYQLWVLEPVSAEDTTQTALMLLLQNLAMSTAPQTAEGTSNKEIYEWQKRSIYALSSALRGNIDVQTAVQAIRHRQHKNGGSNSDSVSSNCWLVEQLRSFALSPDTTSEVQRKVWSLVSDLVQEAHFIHSELDSEIQALLLQTNSGVGGEAESKDVNDTVIDIQGNSGTTGTGGAGTTASTAAFAAQQAVESLKSLSLLGESFLTEQWLQIASAQLQLSMREMFTIHASTHTAVKVDEDGTESITTVSTADKSHAVSVHATVNSLLTYFRDAFAVLKSSENSDSSSSSSKGGNVVLKAPRITLQSACGLLKADLQMVAADVFALAEMEPETYSDVLEAAGELSGEVTVLC